MEELFENIFKKIPENHELVMPLRRARSGVRYLLFLFGRIKKECPNDINIDMKIEYMVSELIDELKFICRNIDSMKDLQVAINVFKRHLSDFMNGCKHFIEENKSRKCFISYNNYLRVKKIQRLTKNE